MTNYEKLVETLRWTANEYKGSIMDEYDKDTMNAAADAIEALQAENPIVESVLVDKMRQQMEETACHCNVKENAELIARILDDDVDGKVFELPKRGEIVLCKECIHFTHGGWCDREFDWFPVDENDFCSMAEKMEVQDERTDKA